MSPLVMTKWIANLSSISVRFQGKVKQHFLEGMPQLRFKLYQYIVKYCCLLLILQVEGGSRLVAPVGELVEEHQLPYLSQDNGKRKIELSYVA